VSPEVAPRMLIDSPRFSSTYSNRLPSNCIAMSLKASVGPLERASSPNLPRSSQRKGVICPGSSPPLAWR